MKVFRRAGTPDRSTNTAYEVPKLQTHVSSCQAIKNAVSTLYNMGDFEMTKIGEGFFSEVFKVSKIFREINSQILTILDIVPFILAAYIRVLASL